MNMLHKLRSGLKFMLMSMGISSPPKKKPAETIPKPNPR
jgi:hypothetical protein